MVDWGAGHYEHTAEDLLPVAEDLFARASIRHVERVLDVACGTGNAALLAARDGAATWGVDLAPRLIEVARERAKAARLSAHFDVGDAQALPYGDAELRRRHLRLWGHLRARPEPCVRGARSGARPGWPSVGHSLDA